jgi:hypothetical protein
MPLADFDLADVWVLTETMARAPFQVANFYAFHALAVMGEAGRPRGGVSVLVAPSLPAPALVSSGTNHLVVQIDTVLLVAAYFSPAMETSVFVEELAEIVASLPTDRHIILAGDFNCRIDRAVHPERTILFLDLIGAAGLRLCSRPLPFTFDAEQGASTIDLFATTLPIEDCLIPEPITGRSIHLLKSHIPIGMHFRRPQTRQVTQRPPKLSKYARQDILQEALTEMALTATWSTGDMDDAAGLLGAALRSAIPSARLVNRLSQPWFNASCYRARAMVEQARILKSSHSFMRPLYIELRKRYKLCLREQRATWQAEYEAKLLQQAEASPYKFGRSSNDRAVCPIQADIMRAHFRDIAGGVASAPGTVVPVYQLALAEDQLYWTERMNDWFTTEEVQEAINNLPTGKAEGPDGIRYEHLKNSPVLTERLTELYNRCLSESFFPADWTVCLMVLIPKGKGDLGLPESWRGISKKSVLGKLLASLLAKRLLRFLTNCDLLPPQQHGFLPGRSTSSAIDSMMAYLEANLRTNGSPVYAIFIDFKAAFNTASRSVIVSTLAELGVSGNFLKLINAMLAPNLIKLFDGIRILPEFVQDTGLPQGDTIASLLFVVLLIHLPAEIMNRVPAAEPDLYADDLLILALLLSSLREATLVAKQHAAERGLEINWQKTKIIKFRGGGRLAAADVFSIDGNDVPFVSSFIYLGVTLTVTAATFSRHVRDRRAKAIAAIRQLPSPRLLSLKTALALFRCRIAPMVTYGLSSCWTYLKTSDFLEVDGVLLCFLRRALGVSKFASSRRVLLLTGAHLITEDFRASHDLPETANYEAYIAIWEEKLADVDEEFLGTSAMTNQGWAAPLSENRSTLCRYALHGFHHVFCSNSAFHDPGPECQCRFCDEGCQKYHFPRCPCPPVSSILQLTGAERAG